MNERGERLIEWCCEKDLCITNTWFAKPEKMLWTWANANGRRLNQINYILAPKRFMPSVLDSSTAVRADCGSDHNPVVVKLRIKLILPCKETKKKLPDWDNISPKIVEEIHGTLEGRLGNVDQSKMSIKESYGIFVRAINEASECVPKSKKQNRKYWITEEIVMDDFRLIHSRVIKECFKARESYLNTKCKEVETLYHIMPMEVHRNIRQLAGRYRSFSKHTGIRDNEGKLLMDESDICQRWSEYIENLYDDPNRSDEPLLFDGILSGPGILESDVRQAIKTAKIRKAPGPDNVRFEKLKLLNETALKYLKHLMNKVYERGRLTKEMCQSIFMSLPKKAGTDQKK